METQIEIASVKHTPGPFKVITRGNQLGIRSIVVVSVPKGNKPVHRANGVTPEHLATAHLFAKSPDMLAALEAIRNARDYFAQHGEYPKDTISPTGKYQCFDDWAADLADAAIPKTQAKG